jgi:hypothetical protein
MIRGLNLPGTPRGYLYLYFIKSPPNLSVKFKICGITASLKQGDEKQVKEDYIRQV